MSDSQSDSCFQLGPPPGPLPGLRRPAVRGAGGTWPSDLLAGPSGKPSAQARNGHSEPSVPADGQGGDFTLGTCLCKMSWNSPSKVFERMTCSREINILITQLPCSSTWDVQWIQAGPLGCGKAAWGLTYMFVFCCFFKNISFKGYVFVNIL